MTETLIVEWLENQSIDIGHVQRGELSELSRDVAELYVHRGLAQIPESVIVIYTGNRDQFVTTYKRKKYVFKRGVSRTVPAEVARELKHFRNAFDIRSSGQVVVLRSAKRNIFPKRKGGKGKKRSFQYVTPNELENLEKDKHFTIKYKGNMGDVLRATCIAEALYYLGHSVSLKVKPEYKPLLENNPYLSDAPEKDVLMHEIDLDKVRVHGLEMKNKLRTVTWLETLSLNDSTYRKPTYVPTEEEIHWACTQIVDRSKYVIAVSRYASVNGKTWWGWDSLIEKLKTDEEVQVVVVDNQKDGRFEYELRQACAIVAVADLLLTNDSLHLHVAGAMDVPTICLFGNTNGDVMTQDYPFCKVVQGKCEKGKPCWYEIFCGKDYKLDTLPCLDSIKVDRVLEEIERQRS